MKRPAMRFVLKFVIYLNALACNLFKEQSTFQWCKIEILLTSV